MPKRILITDDALFMRVTLKNILVSHGYTIAGEAANGQEAIDQYEDYRPDLVILDAIMPVMDGISAARRIRQRHPNANIVACMASGQNDMVVQAIQAGATDYIVKPFQPERVIEAVRKLIG